MTDIFVFGTMCHAPLLDVVAGAPVPRGAAALPGAEVVWVAGKSWPMLVERPGAHAAGYLIHPEDKALARLDFYERCFGYTRVPMTVETAHGPRKAEAWMPDRAPGAAGGPWQLEEWARVWGAVTVEAAVEVMRQSQTSHSEEVGQRYWMILARAQSRLRADAWVRPRKVGAGLRRGDVEVMERTYPYDKFFGVEDLTIRARQFDGTLSPPQRRAVFKVADAVTVLPYDPVRDRILLIEQLRLGAFAHGDAAPWLLEPVAGIVDAGETEEACARREATEEAGLSLGALHFVARYYPSPGGIAQVIASYIAVADLADGITGTHGVDGEGEDILSHLVPFDVACDLLVGGDMCNAPLVMSFQWLLLNRDRLRAAG